MKRKTGITNQQIKDIILSKLNLKVSKIKQAKGGMINDVFFIKVGERELVLKVSPHEGPRFGGEYWALKQCSQNNIPVPKALALGTVRPKLPYPTRYLLATRIPGKRVQSPSRLKLRSAKTSNYLRKAGYLLSKVHTIKTRGFGWLGTNGKGVYKSWKEFLLEPILNEKLLPYLSEEGFIDKNLEKSIPNFLNSEEEYLQLESPFLLHGDFFLDHIFTNKGRVSGVIDFENCISGDPLYDLATFELYHEVGRYPSPLPHFLEGYKNGFTKEDLERKIVFYKLQKALPLIWWWEKQEKGLKKLLAPRRLAALVKTYLGQLERTLF